MNRELCVLLVRKEDSTRGSASQKEEKGDDTEPGEVRVGLLSTLLLLVLLHQTGCVEDR